MHAMIRPFLRAAAALAATIMIVGQGHAQTITTVAGGGVLVVDFRSSHEFMQPAGFAAFVLPIPAL